jgi:CubicO group peptidase (beta-lactamase class C family)
MTAALIMELAQENKLNLDDPVSKYVPGVPNGGNITIAELLNMRSGLYNYSNDCWPLRSCIRLTFRPVQPTSTTTPTTRWSA